MLVHDLASARLTRHRILHAHHQGIDSEGAVVEVDAGTLQEVWPGQRDSSAVTFGQGSLSRDGSSKQLQSVTVGLETESFGLSLASPWHEFHQHALVN